MTSSLRPTPTVSDKSTRPNGPLLEVSDLTVEYWGAQGAVTALDGADLVVRAGESIGIVGESGSGKSTFGLAVGRLLPPSARITRGDVRVNGTSVRSLDDEGIRTLRRSQLSFIFQDPMATLDPTMPVGRQLRHALPPGRDGDVHRELERVQLTDPARVARSYPHQLSGGMAQRVAIAIALAGNPSLLVADEPTAALDTAVRASILELLFSLPREVGLGLVFLSHDLRSVARYCDRVAVMYAGRLVEVGPSRECFEHPVHPYTQALLLSAPGVERIGERLRAIPGLPPVLRGSAGGCAFVARCSWAVERCSAERPDYSVIDGRRVLCHRAAETARSDVGYQVGPGVVR
jgi:oligopeptide/dipeptide ABC transporter ATP-binding protein